MLRQRKISLASIQAALVVQEPARSTQHFKVNILRQRPRLGCMPEIECINNAMTSISRSYPNTLLKAAALSTSFTLSLLFLLSMMLWDFLPPHEPHPVHTHSGAALAVTSVCFHLFSDDMTLDPQCLIWITIRVQDAIGDGGRGDEIGSKVDSSLS